MKPYLTDEEIEHITHPRTQGAARIRYLRNIGVKCEPRPNGQPLVWRYDFEAAKVAPAANDGRNSPTQNWAQLREKVQNGSRGEKTQRRQPARA